MFQDFLSYLGMKKTNLLNMQMLRKKIPLSLKAQKFPLKKKKKKKLYRQIKGQVTMAEKNKKDVTHITKGQFASYLKSSFKPM